MPHKYIWIKNQRYYLYEIYPTYRQAIKIAKLQKRINKSRWFIIKFEKGFLFPEIKYALYLNKVVRII